MIEEIWNKKIVVLIEMDKTDIADQYTPLPLLMNMYWNHYIGFYYEDIKSFFMAYAPFPFQDEQFHLILKQTSQIIEPTTIFSHLITENQLCLTDTINTIKFVCKFRRIIQKNNQTDLKRYYKNNIKASTALRYGKLGASMLTVKMSTNNVNDMFQNYMKNNYQGFMGSDDYDSDQLGYSFLVHMAEKIPVRIKGKDILIERAAEKDITFKDFLVSLFSEEIVQKICIILHGVIIKNIQEPLMKNLEKYCHPDGFLYIHIK